jgi:hypothetical protein
MASETSRNHDEHPGYGGQAVVLEGRSRQAIKPFDARLGTHKIHRLSARNGTLKNYWWYADAFGKGS